MKRTFLILFFFSMLSSQTKAQSDAKSNTHLNVSATVFPELIYTDIVGAPKLSKPILIMGNELPVIAKGNGIAAPAFWDWDGDGKKDLLIGEFLSGIENGLVVGNFIRVYKNIGDNKNPKFTDRFDYARHPNYLGKGTPLSTLQACCMGFTPQFIDLDLDGQIDLISGQYDGDVSWFRGIEDGFEEGQLLDQEGDKFNTNYEEVDINNIMSPFYWLYSTVSFGDFNEDGLYDMVVGGQALRISKNVGTNEVPKFGRRIKLLDLKGNPLKIFDPETKKEALPKSGSYMISPLVIDWDQDGILDILATNSYTIKGMPAVVFFRGVKTAYGHRFESGIPLFEGKDNSKAIPGRWPHINVTDWNDDGINDLLIGTSVVTLNKDDFNTYLSWNWEKETGVQKYDPGNMSNHANNGLQDQWVQRYLNAKVKKAKINPEDYRTLRHRGYVYLMLGKSKNNQ